MPKVVHICHIMTRAPCIGAGEHSAVYTGTVADLGPIPKPRKNRAMKRCHQVFVKLDQIHVKNEIMQVRKMVFLRPR
jgi:hypothetical protein